MNLFFDLDGTLLDARLRMYRLWQHLVPASRLAFDEYWDLKRDKVSHEMLLKKRFGYSEEEIGEFTGKWMSHIEEPDWLSMDEPFEGVTDFFGKCSEKNRLYIVTARQFEDRTLRQIGKYDWSRYVSGIFVSNKPNGKYELIRHLAETGDQGWFIGDTGKDIETGKALGLKTAAVLSGFLSRKRLLEYHPDLIINTVINLVYE